MIKVKVNEQTYELGWQAGNWLDKAGHIWILTGNVLLSEKHGSSYDWKVV